jgi:cytochrome c peroxidase
MRCIYAGITLYLVIFVSAVSPSYVHAGTEWDERALARISSVQVGLPPVPTPAENPPTVEKISLGRKLFFDRRLSFNNTMSCGMCHIPEQGFTNNELATPVGVEGRTVRRNSPTIVNSGYITHVFHDGRETSLETQAIAPLIAHNEMANPAIGYVIDKIKRLEDYDGLFENAFGGAPTVDRVGQAIASWERTMVAAGSPFDQWKFSGDEDALTDQQKRGFELFSGKGLCVTCHFVEKTYALFTDDSFHDTGIGYFGQEVAPAETAPVPVEIAPNIVIPVNRDFMASISEEIQLDFGRFEVTREPADMWRFKTPSLRNVAVTAPYMHDGSLRTLEDVVRFYNRGGIAHIGLDPLVQPLDLTDEDVYALVAFLESLTSPALEQLIEDARSAPVGD